MRILLDGHILLWALYEPDHLSERLRDLISDEANDLFVSYATIWEVGSKAAAHRIPLAGSSVDSIIARTKDLGATFLELTLPEIVRSAELPRFHDDPFDRILVAQAQFWHLTIATKDRHIPRYDVPTIW